MKKHLLIASIALISVLQASAQFTAGNIVVLQVGDGSAALSNASTAVFLKEFTPSGASGISVSIPTTGTSKLTVSGSATSEGLISRTDDDANILITGYNSATGVSSIASSTSAVAPRAVGIVDYSAAYAQPYTTTLFNGNNIRSAAGDGLGNYWATGAANGVVYMNTSTSVSTTVSNIRQLHEIGGNLYFSTGSGTTGIYKITGAPTSSGSTATLIAASSSPYGFAINDAGTILYIVNDNATAITKYTFGGGVWTFAYTVNTTQCRGLAVDFSGANPVLYATTTSNTLIRITDVGASSASTVIATAPSNTAWRGVTLAPAAATPGTFTVSNQIGLTSLTSVFGSPSVTPGSFDLSGASLTGTVTVQSASTSFEIASSSGGPYSSTLTYTPAGGIIPAQPVTVYVRLSAIAPVGAASSTIGITSPGAIPASVSVSGNVAGPMLVSSPHVLNGFNSVSSAVSGVQSFSLTGSNLTANATLTITGPYEYSTDSISFLNTPLNIAQSGGNLSQTIYVRIPAGQPLGNAAGAIYAASTTAHDTIRLYGSITQPFTAGNIVALRVGDGISTLVNTGNPVFLDEYTTGGTLIQSIPLPTATAGSNNRLVMSGVSTSEGLLLRSADGRYLTLAGYDSNIPSSGSISSTSANRSVAVVNYNGYVDVTTSLTDLAVGNNPRSAFTTNGNALWATGGTNGVRYTTKGTVGGSVQVSSGSAVVNFRALNYAQSDAGIGQLYVSSAAAGGVRIGTVGTGAPTSSGGSVTNLPGLPTTTTNPYQFFFADISDLVAGVDVLYVANDGGGISKYSLVSGSWNANGTADATGIYRGLAGKVNTINGNIEFYAARNFDGTASGNGGDIVRFTDNSGYNGTIATTPAFTIVAVLGSGSNKSFRSVALAPVNTTCSDSNVVWEGNTSADYNLAGNWCGGVPTATSDVIIKANSINLPRMYGSHSLDDININSGSAFTVTGGATLSIGGVLTPTGTFVTNTGNLVFNGTTLQSIPDLTLNDITFNGNAFTLNGDVTAAGTITFTNGKVTIGNHSLTSEITGTVAGGNSNSYAVTDNEGGLTAFVGSTPVTFPVGVSSYNPATITNNGAGASTTGFTVSLVEEVLDNGLTGSPVTEPVVNRSWIIENDMSGVANAVVSLQWNPGEDINTFDYNHVYLAHYNTGTGNWEGLTASAATAPAAGGFPGSGPFTATATGVTNFSPFTVASNSNTVYPLPLTLTDLNAVNAGTVNIVSWKSGLETFGFIYEVQSSIDAVSFKAIGTANGTGSNSTYSFKDQQPAKSINYYRLRMTDASGAIAYSEVVSAILRDGTNSLVVTPNPAIDHVTVQLDGTDGLLQLLDASGRIVFSNKPTGLTETISLSGFAPGVYQLKYQSSNTVSTATILKQ